MDVKKECRAVLEGFTRKIIELSLTDFFVMAKIELNGKFPLESLSFIKFI